MHVVHAKTCGTRQTGTKLQMQLKRTGYCWPIYIVDRLGFSEDVKYVNIMENLYIH